MIGGYLYQRRREDALHEERSETADDRQRWHRQSITAQLRLGETNE